MVKGTSHRGSGIASKDCTHAARASQKAEMISSLDASERAHWEARSSSTPPGSGHRLTRLKLPQPLFDQVPVPEKPDEAQLPPGFPPQPLRHAFQGAGVIAHLPESVQAFLHCFSVFPPCRREDWRTFSSAGSRISFPGRSFSRFSSPCSNSSIASAPSS